LEEAVPAVKNHRSTSVALAEPGPAAGPLRGRPDRVRAAVSLPEAATEVRYLDTAGAIGAVGWLRVESSAVCGTDVSLYQAGLDWPTVMGHHVVGRITALDPSPALAWRVAVGDLVALEEYLPCMRPDCEECSVRGRYRMCPASDLWKGRRRVGLISSEEGSGLYGGNAEYMQLNANSIVHKLPADLDPDLASWTQPFANAVDWTVNAGGAREGSTVVVIGPGYHGIAAVAAARAAGAGRIIAVGRSYERLEIAEALGAVPVVNDGGTDLGALIDTATAGKGTDLILDTVGLGRAVTSAAAGTLRKLGRLVLAGLGPVPVSEVDLKALIRGANTITGVRGRSPEAVRQSIDILASGTSGLELVPTTHVPLEEVGEMLHRLANGKGPSSPHVVIRPQPAGATSQSAQPS
jgi:threonine dehydrogenase-like Zn-dependent dehydrogenase